MFDLHEFQDQFLMTFMNSETIFYDLPISLRIHEDHQKLTCLTQLTLGPYVAQIWSRYVQNLKERNLKFHRVESVVDMISTRCHDGLLVGKERRPFDEQLQHNAPAAGMARVVRIMLAKICRNESSESC